MFFIFLFLNILIKKDLYNLYKNNFYTDYCFKKVFLIFLKYFFINISIFFFEKYLIEFFTRYFVFNIFFKQINQNIFIFKLIIVLILNLFIVFFIVNNLIF